MHHNARPKDRDVTIATRRRSTAKIRAQHRLGEGEPASHFQCCNAEGWRPPTQNVVLLARVSTRQQHADGNHLSQLTELRVKAARWGWTVVESIAEVGPGWEVWRSGLLKALIAARRTNAFILACDVSRYLRHPCFNAKTKPNARPTEHDLRQLSELAGDVAMVTLLEPDATPSIERSNCRSRGQQYRQRTGGRRPEVTPGYKKARRERLLPEARELRKHGASLAVIASKFGLRRSTVNDWLKRDEL